MYRREAISIERGEYKLPYDMRLTEALGLLRYNPPKMLMAFSAYYMDELQRKVRTHHRCSARHRAPAISTGFPKFTHHTRLQYIVVVCNYMSGNQLRRSARRRSTADSNRKRSDRNIRTYDSFEE